MPSDERVKILSELHLNCTIRNQKKTEQVGFRCTREIKNKIRAISFILDASMSDTIAALLERSMSDILLNIE